MAWPATTVRLSQLPIAPRARKLLVVGAFARTEYFAIYQSQYRQMTIPGSAEATPAPPSMLRPMPSAPASQTRGKKGPWQVRTRTGTEYLLEGTNGDGVRPSRREELGTEYLLEPEQNLGLNARDRCAEMGSDFGHMDKIQLRLEETRGRAGREKLGQAFGE